MILYSLGILPQVSRNTSLKPPWVHPLHTECLLNLLWMCHHLTETTSTTQALLKVTDDLVPLWSKIFWFDYCKKSRVENRFDNPGGTICSHPSRRCSNCFGNKMNNLVDIHTEHYPPTGILLINKLIIIHSE